MRQLNTATDPISLGEWATQTGPLTCTATWTIQIGHGDHLSVIAWPPRTAGCLYAYQLKAFVGKLHDNSLTSPPSMYMATGCALNYLLQILQVIKFHFCLMSLLLMQRILAILEILSLKQLIFNYWKEVAYPWVKASSTGNFQFLIPGTWNLQWSSVGKFDLVLFFACYFTFFPSQLFGARQTYLFLLTNSVRQTGFFSPVCPPLLSCLPEACTF